MTVALSKLREKSTIADVIVPPLSLVSFMFLQYGWVLTRLHHLCWAGYTPLCIFSLYVQFIGQWRFILWNSFLIIVSFTGVWVLDLAEIFYIT